MKLRTTLILLVVLSLYACQTPPPLRSGTQSLNPSAAATIRFTRTPQDTPTDLPLISSTPGIKTATTTATRPAGQPEPTQTLQPTQTAQPTRLSPERWQEWPVIPAVSDKARSIYAKGIAQGNNPRAFSRIGDCQNISDFFLGPFETPTRYNLGAANANLSTAIEHFAGSFERQSVAVKGGFNVASVLSPLQSDPKLCTPGETPLACEIRINRPSIAIISMETWWSKSPAQEYEKYMRQILDYTIARGVLPILATKADNVEGDNSINATLVRLAAEYDIPLWNFYAAAQPLPNHGVSTDGFHLTQADVPATADPLRFKSLGDPKEMIYGWPVRNLTALQALYSVWQAVNETK